MRFMLLLLTVAALAQPQSTKSTNDAHYKTAETFNGRFWNNISPAMKIGYLIGFTEGIHATLLNIDGGNSVAKYTPVKDELIASKFTFGEIRSEMDRFYADAANARIPINLALVIVNKRMKGEPEDKLADLISAARQIVSDFK